MTEPTDDLAAQPVVSLIEWPAHDLDLGAARRLAAETAAQYERIPGLFEWRFFGDFETGSHFYLQVWQEGAALDAYAANEAMFRIRTIAEPYVAGRPSRRVLVDYTPPRR
jgi:quinol monooxygenase YgiN